MGKSNRIRNGKAVKTVNAPVTHEKKQGMPGWAMSLIAIVITVAVLLSAAVTLLSSNGVFNRMTVSATSENYKVNNSMMTYYFNVQYQSFLESYGDYLSNFSLDTSKSLKKQEFGKAEEGKPAYETSFLGTFEGTWFDYFMSITTSQVESLLVYCEEADKLGVKLEQEDMDELDTTMKTIEATAGLYGYNLNGYLAAMYGEGVTEKDVRKAMEISALASKCAEHISETIENAIVADEDRINKTYDDNKLDYDRADYIYYTFTVKYTDIAKEVLGSDYTKDELTAEKDKVLEAYKAEIEAVKNLAEVLAGKTSVADFEAYIANKVAGDNFDTLYEGITLTEDDIPSEDDLKAIREGMIAKIVEEIAADKTETDSDVVLNDGVRSIYSVEITENLGKNLDKIKTDAFAATLKAVESAVVEGAGYAKDQKVAEWLFDDERKVLDTNSFEDGDGADGAEVKAEKESFQTSVYMVTKTQYKTEDLTKNIAYVLFSKEEDAKAAIEALKEKGEMTFDVFEEYCETATGTSGHNHIDNYSEGELGSDAMDKWIFAEDTELGDMTETPVKVEDKVFAVIYYHGDGEAEWYKGVKNTLYSEDYNAYYEDMQEAHTVEINEKATAKVKA